MNSADVRQDDVPGIRIAAICFAALAKKTGTVADALRVYEKCRRGGSFSNSGAIELPVVLINERQIWWSDGCLE